jgi:hypothetical protein
VQSETSRKVERASRRQLGLQLSTLPGVAVAAERGLRLVGLAADEDPELGLLGVLALREVAAVCESTRCAKLARRAGVGHRSQLRQEVSPQAVRQRHAARLEAS